MIYKIALSFIIALIAFMIYKNNSMPSYLGMTDNRFSPMPSSPNAVSSHTDLEDKKVQPLAFESIDDAKKNVKRVLAQMPNNTIHTDTIEYMHIVFTTETMKYHDDVELFFDTTANLIHYRSQSRVGYSDKGLNRDRYNQFSTLYSSLK